MSSFDTFSADGDSAGAEASGGDRPFDDGYVGYDPRLPSQRYDDVSYAPAFPTDDDVPVSAAGDFSGDPTSPDIYGFQPPPEEEPFSPPAAAAAEAEAEAAFFSSSPDANGNGRAELGEGVFSSDGPVLPPPGEMQSEERFALREWRR